MIETIQTIGVAAALISCAFWLAGAGVRFSRWSLFKLTGPDSLTGALQRQSFFNGMAAVFAAIAAGCQAALFYLS